MWWQPVIFRKIEAVPSILLGQFPPFYRIMSIHRLRIHYFEKNFLPDFLMLMKDHLPNARRNHDFVALEMLAMKIASIIPICSDAPSEIRAIAIEIHYGYATGISSCHCMATAVARRIAAAK